MYITVKIDKNQALASIATIMNLIEYFVIDKQCDFHSDGVDIHILTIPCYENHIYDIINKHIKQMKSFVHKNQ